MSLARPLAVPGAGCIVRSISAPRGGAIDPSASAYAAAVEAAGGTLAPQVVRRLSRFWSGLDALGIRSNFLDGACFRADTQPPSGSILSLRGLSNATLTGGTRGHSALLFDGVDDWLGGAIPDSSGARTIIGPFAGNTHPPSSGALVKAWVLTGGTTKYRISFLGNSVVGGNLYVAECDGFHNTQWAAMGHSIDNSLYRTFVSRELNLGYNVADSFVGDKLERNGSPVQAKKIGMADKTFQYFCGGAWKEADTGTISSYIMCALPGWLLFNKALSDGEVSSVVALCDTTLWPEWNLVIEGDSIIFKAVPYITDCDPLWGGNHKKINLSEGGKHAYTAVANLGTSDGFDVASNLAGSLPRVALIAIGANDVANYTPAQKPAATIYADLVTLAAYARSAGATVGMSTIIPNGTLVPDKEANRVALNALIVAGAGVDYDFLIDTDTWIYTTTAVRPVWDDSNIYFDEVHLNEGAAGTGCDLWGDYIAGCMDTANCVP